MKNLISLDSKDPILQISSKARKQSLNGIQSKSPNLHTSKHSSEGKNTPHYKSLAGVIPTSNATFLIGVGASREVGQQPWKLTAYGKYNIPNRSRFFKSSRQEVHSPSSFHIWNLNQQSTNNFPTSRSLSEISQLLHSQKWSKRCFLHFGVSPIWTSV
jgi:hypothetical protein